MHIRVEPERLLQLVAEVSRVHAEGVAVARSPELLHGSLVEMSAGEGALATAAVRFVDVWGQTLQDAVRELGWLADTLLAVSQLYDTVERANTLPGRWGPVPGVEW